VLGVILRLSNVTKRFGLVRALDSVSLEVREGEVVGLLGPNGAGKTTLIKVSLGLMRRDSGLVLLNGLDPYVDPSARVGVSAIFERPSLPDSLRVRDLLFHVARVYGGGLDDVRRAVKLAGLEGHEWKMFSELSAGLKQRAAIAHALLANPRFIVADEPTSNLDPVERLRILELIATLNRDEGITFLVSSHVIPEVTRVSSRLVVMSRGRVVASGSPSELLYKNPVARIRCSDPEKLASMLEASGFNVRVEGYNVLVEVGKGDYGALLELLTIASRNGVFLMNVDFIGATLEELLSSGDST
jgi:ABC-2 type transport system ATP-binding protein